MKSGGIIAIIGFMSLPLLYGCGGRDKSVVAKENVLVEYGDTMLTLRDVERRIPAGLATADSIAMFNAIVDRWIEEQIFSEIGRENINDMEQIDALTQQYRNRLIAESYRKSMMNNRLNNNSGVSEDSLRHYVKTHPEHYVLDTPLVKGVYVRIPSNSPSLSEVRQWVFDGSMTGIDNLEKYGLRDVLQYIFFEDRWMDWQSVAEQIPYHFSDSDVFVSTKGNFETSYKGVTYLLHISDYVPDGSHAPEEYALQIAASEHNRLSAAEYERELTDGLLRQAIKEKRLRGINYNPLTHTYKEN